MYELERQNALQGPGANNTLGKKARGMGERNLLHGTTYHPTSNNGAAAAAFALNRQHALDSSNGVGLNGSQRRMSWEPMKTRKNNGRQGGGAGERYMNSAYVQQLQNEMRAQRATNATRNAAEAARRKKERERGAVATQLEPMNFNVEAGQGPASMLNGGYTRRRVNRKRKSVRRRY
jgi:hypothetical protein